MADKPKYAIMADHLVLEVNQCTCAGGGPESGGAHESHCGLEPIVSLEQIFAEHTAIEKVRDVLKQVWGELHPIDGPALARSIQVCLSALDSTEPEIIRPYQPHGIADLPMDFNDFTSDSEFHIEVRVRPRLGPVIGEGQEWPEKTTDYVDTDWLGPAWTTVLRASSINDAMARASLIRLPDWHMGKDVEVPATGNDQNGLWAVVHADDGTPCKHGIPVHSTTGDPAVQTCTDGRTAVLLKEEKDLKSREALHAENVRLTDAQIGHIQRVRTLERTLREAREMIVQLREEMAQAPETVRVQWEMPSRLALLDLLKEAGNKPYIDFESAIWGGATAVSLLKGQFFDPQGEPEEPDTGPEWT